MNITGKMSLIDFGACREYRKDFVDDYLKLVWSAANRDDAEIMRVRQPLIFELISRVRYVWGCRTKSPHDQPN